jgi:hypothetical protein
MKECEKTVLCRPAGEDGYRFEERKPLVNGLSQSWPVAGEYPAVDLSAFIGVHRRLIKPENIQFRWAPSY